jgi:uncharacterized protein (DUF697 family)
MRMNKINSLTNFWTNVREADLRPLREQALRGVHLAIIGEPGSGRSTLADQMRRDPNRPQLSSDTPVLVLDLDSAGQASNADLIILMLDSRKVDSSREQEMVRLWRNAGKRVLVFINQFEAQQERMAVSPWTSREHQRVVWGSPLDGRFMIEQFAPAMIDSLPDLLLGLGRYFPLFRIPIAHYLINDTCFSNAAYALSTGLAEIVAVLDIPITIADSIILTKSQAFLVYKLGLAVGYSTRWQDYIAEFSGVLGGGFVWRQIARSLIGLIPVWGIIPKTAIAYAGTFVVGNVVLQWYLTGKKVSGKQMQQLYALARERGKSLASNLLRRIPRPRLQFRLPKRRTKSLPAPRKAEVCAKCGKTSAKDASFCQYCGTPFGQTGRG